LIALIINVHTLGRMLMAEASEEAPPPDID
jgi:hypothetical protein